MPAILASETPTRRRRASPRASAKDAADAVPESATELEALRAAMEALSIGVVIAESVPGHASRIAWHNGAYTRIVGVKARGGTPFGELPFALYLPDRMTRVEPADWPAPTAARTGDAVRERELHLRRSNGEWRVLLVSAAPLQRPPGEAGGRAAGILLDVTERRQAEADLSRRGQLLRAVIETSPDPIFVKNRESQVLFANPATLRVVGKPSDQVMGRKDSEFYDDREIGAAIEATDRRIMESAAEEVVEEVVVTPEGRRLFLSTKTPWRDSSGRVIGIVGIARDITHRKAAEEALRSSERRFRALIENSSDMLVLVDARGAITFWSPAAREGLGWTAEEALGRDALELVHPDDRGPVSRAFARTMDSAGRPVHHRARIACRDGTHRLVDGVARDLRDDAAIGSVVMNLRDVTEEARTEELLLQSQKLDSIGRMAGGIAHDFNNLLTVILCSVESEGEALDAGRAVAREDVDQIREASQRASELTRHLLAFARRQVIDPVVVDLNGLVARSERVLQRMLGETVQITVEARPGLWPVRCDPAQVEQVLVNLAVNARDAMPGGGSLRISMDNVGADALPADLPAGDWVRLRVRDTGVGMSRDVRDHIFEPFFTTKPSGRGTGLGLATVYGIVRQAGGHVRVESEPGKGSTFDVLLPRSVDVEAGQADAGRAAGVGGEETVLLVEDDPGVREAAARSLRAGGYTVLTAPDAASAIEVAGASSTPPHLLVTDVVMPGTTGRQLADRMRAERPGLRVLFLSGYAPELFGPEGLLDPGTSFLAKPFSPIALLSRVRQVLDAP